MSINDGSIKDIFVLENDLLQSFLWLVGLD